MSEIYDKVIHQKYNERQKDIYEYPVFLHEYQIISQIVGRGYKILDFGCGRGKIYKEYLEAEGLDIEYVGIDIDKSLDVDFPLYHSVDEFIEAGYPPRYFDGLFLLDIMEALGFDEMMEVLEKLNPYIDGDIVIMTPNVKCLDYIRSDPQHKTFYPVPELKGILRHLGFEAKQIMRGKGLYQIRMMEIKKGNPNAKALQEVMKAQEQICLALGLDWYGNILVIGERYE